jgi:hypothetical protein
MTHARRGAIIALALAFSTAAVPASARTFDFNSHGSIVLQPLPSQFACTMQRALLNPEHPVPSDPPRSMTCSNADHRSSHDRDAEPSRASGDTHRRPS